MGNYGRGNGGYGRGDGGYGRGNGGYGRGNGGYGRGERKRKGPEYHGLAASIAMGTRAAIVIPAGGYIIVSAWTEGDGRGNDNKLSCFLSGSATGQVESSCVPARNDGGSIVIGLGETLLLSYGVARNVVGDVLNLLDTTCRDDAPLEDVLAELNDILAASEFPEDARRQEGRQEGRRSGGRQEGRRSEGRQEGRQGRQEGRKAPRGGSRKRAEDKSPPAEDDASDGDASEG